MYDGRFEWDDAKAEANLAKHGVSFPLAVQVFDDPNAIEDLDPNPGEERWRIIGTAEGRILFVVYKELADARIRLVSARKATKNEQKRYFEEYR